MKLDGAQARQFLSSPGSRFGGVLLHGPNPIRVADKRVDLVSKLVGPGAADELRLTVIPAARAGRNPSEVVDGLKMMGFFPGPRAVVVSDATDSLATSIGRALDTRRDGDAVLIVTASSLKPRSRLRKLFESNRNTAAIGVYDDPLSRDEIEAMASTAGLTRLSPDGVGHLAALSEHQTVSEIRQTIEKLALYSMTAGSGARVSDGRDGKDGAVGQGDGDEPEIGTEEIERLAPDSRVTGLDDVLYAVAEGRPSEVVPLMLRLYAQGVGPSTICTSAYRYFRSLHAAAVEPGSPYDSLARQRPPVFGKRRTRMARQVDRWAPKRLEGVLEELFDAELGLRRSDPTPGSARLERTLLRVAWRAPRR